MGNNVVSHQAIVVDKLIYENHPNLNTHSPLML